MQIIISNQIDRYELTAVHATHGVIVISNRNRGHDYDYECELVIGIVNIHGQYNVIAIVIESNQNHDYISRLHDIFSFIFFCHIHFVGLIIRNLLKLPAHILWQNTYHAWWCFPV